MDSLARAREVVQKFFSDNADPIPDNLATNQDLERRIATAIDEARLEEREACAKECERVVKEHRGTLGWINAQYCVDALRERGKV